MLYPKLIHHKKGRLKYEFSKNYYFFKKNQRMLLDILNSLDVQIKMIKITISFILHSKAKKFNKIYLL